MLNNSWNLTLLAGALILAMAACTPVGSEPGVTAEQTATEAGSPALSAVTSPADTGGVAGDTVSSTETVAQGDTTTNAIVAATPMSAEELAAQPPGQTEPGAGAAPEGEQTEPDTTEILPPAGWSTYADPALGFAVVYPDGFVIGPADPARLSSLQPTPSQSIYFVDRATAESAFAGTDAPDLEVRVYETGPVTSLDTWLAGAGVITDGDGKTVSPYQTATVSGLEVCESTMVFPPCSVFIAGSNQVFQLRSLTLEGETMAESFYRLP